jgi:predicted ArsR family transcriptional regulator
MRESVGAVLGTAVCKRTGQGGTADTRAGCYLLISTENRFPNAQAATSRYQSRTYCHPSSTWRAHRRRHRFQTGPHTQCGPRAAHPMERDGVVQRAGRRPGTTRPSQVFELTSEVEQLLSQAYLPFLTHVTRVFASALPTRQVDRLMRDVGKSLANDLTLDARSSASLRARVSAASDLLNKQLGAVTHVEGNGGYIIRGVACPLAALTGKHPAVCLALESLLTELIGTPVRECCDRTARPKCCFEINVPNAESDVQPSRKHRD